MLHNENVHQYTNHNKNIKIDCCKKNTDQSDDTLLVLENVRLDSYGRYYQSSYAFVQQQPND